VDAFVDAVNGAREMDAPSHEDKIYAAKMKLSGDTQLREDSLQWERFTEIFKQRFQDIMPY
jgi:hypothetical protein